MDADRTLEAFISSCGSGAPGAPPASAAVAPSLMRAQAALEAGNTAAAAALLAGVRDEGVALSGAMVATRVALYEQVRAAGLTGGTGEGNGAENGACITLRARAGRSWRVVGSGCKA